MISHPVRQRISSRSLQFALVATLMALAATACDTRLASGGGSGLAWGPAGMAFDAAAPAAPPAEAATEVLRDIEEADIVKIIGGRLYALNYNKGLIIVDISDPDAPRVAGTLSLRGRGVEMFVVGDRAYVVLSADYGYYPALAGAAVSDAFMPDYNGSQVAIIDVAEAARPRLLGKINLDGYAQESRRVGNVLYVAGQTIPSWQGGDSPDRMTGAPPPDYAVERGFIASINIADPADIKPVDRKTFRGGAVDMHVSPTAIFVASIRYNDNAGGLFTRVQYADISDPAGAIALRGAFNVPGTIRNRFYMDDFEGVFRICTESSGFGFRTVKLFTYDLGNPDQVVPLGDTEIIRGESLEAVRYDGVRGYAVTFLRVDPLFVIDLSDPARPAVTGHLEVPGYSTHIEPRGDRLIAVGIDDTAGHRPAVSYYDVSDPAAPRELGRVILGPPGSFTESDAVYDEKAFKVIDDLGLIVIPFSHSEYGVGGGEVPPFPIPLPGFGGGFFGAPSASIYRPTCVDAVQMVDFSDTALTQRGWFDARARVQRVGVIGPRVFALSQASLQTIDVSDRDDPKQVGEAEFFDAQTMAQFDQGCGGIIYEPPVRPGPIVVLTVEDLISFLRALDESGLCGTVTVLPGVALFAGMIGLRRRYRRRR